MFKKPSKAGQRLQSNARSLDHFPPLFENIIVIAIVLVIALTLVEDLAIVMRWSHLALVWLTALNFLFDFFFSLEFLGRSLVSIKRKTFRHYLLIERGWIDFLTSFPLLLLVSGPSLYMYLKGNESSAMILHFLAILKTAKAVRVTRILRLIRIIKVFGKIQNSDSLMTNRHVALVSTIAVVAMIVVLVFANFASFFENSDYGEYKQKRQAEMNRLLAASSGAPAENWLADYLKNEEDIVYLRKKLENGQFVTIYENPRAVEMEWTVYKNEYGSKDIAAGVNYVFALSYHPVDAFHARLNILFLLAIVFLVIAFMLFYSRIFAQQVADPLYIMEKGLRSWDYNSEVKIDADFKDEEIFVLADGYNRRWLPLKSQIRNYRKTQKTEKSVLTMGDLL